MAICRMNDFTCANNFFEFALVNDLFLAIDTFCLYIYAGTLKTLLFKTLEGLRNSSGKYSQTEREHFSILNSASLKLQSVDL